MPRENTASESPPLPPLPVLTDAEWRALSRVERQRIRELKLEHRRREAEAIRHVAGGQPPDELPEPTGTPFRDVHGRPLYLANYCYGASCFLMLSGPSSLNNDLSLLRRRGIYTVAVNNAATVIRPNAWVFVDPAEKFHSSIWLDPAVLKFVHHRCTEHRLRQKLPTGEFLPLKLSNGQTARVQDMPGVIPMIRNADFRPSRWLTEPTINWGNSKRSTRRNGFPRDLNVMLCALKLCYVLGFRAVYLLGCDFLMNEQQPYSFAESKHAAACGGNNRKYNNIEAMLRLLKPHFDAAGFHVFNTNERSGLTLYPFVPYTEAIEAASGHVPQDPLDTLDWYKK
jgi:hypothetical protein